MPPTQPPTTRPPRPLPKNKNKRRRELRHRKLERQAIRRRRRARLARRAALTALVLTVASVGGAVAVLSSRSPGSPAAAGRTPTAGISGGTAPAAYTIVSKRDRSWKTEPALTVDTAAHYDAKLRLGQGEVDLALDASAAPHAVNSFAFLAGQHFFDGIYCHRLTTTGIYVLQCGDPTGTGNGGPGYRFTDENLNAPAIKAGTYPAGTVAMANSGPDTNGSQFFLVYKDSPLPDRYTPFGTVTHGMNVLRTVASEGAVGGGDGRPRVPVVMETVTVSKR